MTSCDVSKAKVPPSKASVRPRIIRIDLNIHDFPNFLFGPFSLWALPRSISTRDSLHLHHRLIRLLRPSLTAYITLVPLYHLSYPYHPLGPFHELPKPPPTTPQTLCLVPLRQHPHYASLYPSHPLWPYHELLISPLRHPTPRLYPHTLRAYRLPSGKLIITDLEGNLEQITVPAPKPA